MATEAVDVNLDGAHPMTRREYVLLRQIGWARRLFRALYMGAPDRWTRATAMCLMQAFKKGHPFLKEFYKDERKDSS